MHRKSDKLSIWLFSNLAPPSSRFVVFAHLVRPCTDSSAFSNTTIKQSSVVSSNGKDSHRRRIFDFSGLSATSGGGVLVRRSYFFPFIKRRSFFFASLVSFSVKLDKVMMTMMWKVQWNLIADVVEWGKEERRNPHREVKARSSTILFRMWSFWENTSAAPNFSRSNLFSQPEYH